MRLLAAVVALSCVAGCEKDRGKPAARPRSLLLDYTRADSHAMDGVKAFATTVNPLAAFAVDEGRVLDGAAPALGMMKIAGIDRDAPVHLLLADAGHGIGVVLVAKVSDAKAFESARGQNATIEQHDGWAVIGRDATAVHEIAPYALSTLASAPAPKRPSATIYLSRLVELNPDAIAAMRARVAGPSGTSPQFASIMTGYVDGLVAMAKDTDELRMTLDATSEHMDLDLVAAAKPGSDLGKLAALQQPSDFALLAKLPDGLAAVRIAGRFAFGPYHDGFVRMMTQLYGPPGSPVASAIASIIDGTTGDGAVYVEMSSRGFTFGQLVPVKDRATTETAIARVAEGLATPQTFTYQAMSTTFAATPGTTQYDGVTLHGMEISYDASAAPSAGRATVAAMSPGGKQHTRVGVVDSTLVLAMSPDADSEIAHAIDALRGKAQGFTPSPLAAQLLDAARARKDSFVMMMELSAIKAMLGRPGGDPAPLLVSAGASDGNFRIHVALPSASVRAMQ